MKKYAFLLCFTLLLCATPKSELIDSGSFSIAEAKQEKSIALKRTCLPVEFRQAITDKDAVAFAIHNRVDTVQVFRSYRYATSIFSTDLVRDLRFWKCEGKSAPTFAKKFIKSGRDKARMAFLRFQNTTQSNAENYAWLTETLPEAIDVAMQTRFVYESADKQKVQADFEQIAPSAVKGNEARFAAICEKSELDYAISGEFFFDQAAKKLVIRAAIYHNDKRTIVGEVTAKSPVDASIFGKINDVADTVVKTLSAYEAKR